MNQEEFNERQILFKFSKQERKEKLEEIERQIEIMYLGVIKFLRSQGSWHQLRRWEATFKLWKMRSSFKFPRLDGTGTYEGIMFIGINPSQRSKLENLWEDPFGIYFSSYLKEAEIDPEKIYFTNLYKYPTEENRILTNGEKEEGWNELVEEIKMVNPNIIVCLGNIVWDFLENKKKDIYFPVTLYKISHPSFIKRFPEKKVEYIKQLKKIKQINEQKNINRIPLETEEN